LLKHPNATLYILGAGERHDWKDAIARVQNRIVPLPLQDPRLFMEAADIYLDSYPFCSATSMMEAAGYGTPCVTRFLLSDQARICGMDHPGLAGPLIEVSNEIDYQKKISDLIADGDLRRRIGEEIFHSVAEYNVPPAWSQFIENAFAQATALAPVDNLGLFPDDDIERPFLGEPDCRIEERYGIAHPKHHLLKEHLSDFPLSQRLIHWRRLILDGGFVSAKEAARCLMPEWAVRILKNGF
jgi:hypothetical protein